MKYFLIMLLFIVGCSRSPGAGNETASPIQVDSTAAYFEHIEPSAGEPRAEMTQPRSRQRAKPPTAAMERAEGAPAMASPAPPPPSPAPPVFDVDRILSTLREGQIIFDSPTTMRFKQQTILEVTLYPPQSTAVPEAQEDQIRDSTLMSNRMEAILAGQGFAIENMTPSVQAISGLRPTVWSWQVTPLQTGKQALSLSMLAHITIEGTETPYVIRTYNRNIQVNVTITQRVWYFVSEYFQWIIGGLLIPLVGFLYKRFIKHPRNITD